VRVNFVVYKVCLDQQGHEGRLKHGQRAGQAEGHPDRNKDARLVGWQLTENAHFVLSQNRYLLQIPVLYVARPLEWCAMLSKFGVVRWG